MNIGVFLPEVEDFSENNSGALARWVFEVYKSFNKQDVHIFCPKTKNKVHYGFNTHTINTFHEFDKSRLRLFNLGHHLKHNFYPFAATACSRILGISVCHVLNRYSYVLIIKRFNPKVKIILHMQNDHLLYISDKEFKRVIQSINLLVVCSDYVGDGIRNRIQKEIPELNKTQITTVYNGADGNKFNIEESYTIRHNRQNILFIGRLIPEKGVLELIKAFLILIKGGNKKAILTIVGSGSLKKNQSSEYTKILKEEIKGYENRIIFTGLVENNRLPEYMKNASIFVCPSIWNEPFGMVITEAMASKLPVIASNKGGIPEIIKDSGILIDPANIEQMAKNIQLLLENREKSEKLSINSYLKYNEKFTWEKISAEFKQILKSLDASKA